MSNSGVFPPEAPESLRGKAWSICPVCGWKKVEGMEHDCEFYQEVGRELPEMLRLLLGDE